MKKFGMAGNDEIFEFTYSFITKPVIRAFEHPG